MVRLDIQRERDTPADEWTTLANGHPDPDVLATFGFLWVSHGDGSLAGPEHRGAHAAEPGPKEHEPLVAISVVAIESRGVRGVEGSAKDECPFRCDFVGDATRDSTSHRHEAVR